MALALLAEVLGDQEGQIESLAGIEAGVAMGVVAVGEILLGNLLRAAQTFGDVLAGQLQMDAARMRAFGAMDLEKAADLFEHAVEGSRLVAGGGFDGVPMHGIAGPNDLLSLARHAAQKLGELLGRL